MLASHIIGQVLRLRERGETQKAVAAKLRIGVRSVRRIEQGEHRFADDAPEPVRCGGCGGLRADVGEPCRVCPARAAERTRGVAVA